MVFEQSKEVMMWLVLLLSIMTGFYIYSYLQAYRGWFLQQPFTSPNNSLFDRLKSRGTPFTKGWLAARWGYVRFFHPFVRSFFIRPELGVTTFVLTPSLLLIVYWIQNGVAIQPLILATLFYASVLFFKDIFLSDYPIVNLNRTLHTNQEHQFQVKYTVANIGSKPISNLSLCHRVYDGRGRWLRGIDHPLNYHRQTPITLEPGDVSEEYRVPLEKSIGFGGTTEDWNEVTEDIETPIFVEISAAPSIGHRFLGDREIVRIHSTAPPDQRNGNWEKV